MADPTIRQNVVAVLLKLQIDDDTPAVPDPALDAIPVEADSVTTASPWTTEASNEATGSQVAGAPLIIGQPATFSFRSRIKGAGAGTAYTAMVKPPLHQALAMAAWKPQFHAAIVAAPATAGTANTVTLANTFPAIARALLGASLSVIAGAGAGATPSVVDYSAGRVATLADTFDPPLDATSSVGLPAMWTYAQTSPTDQAARLSDQPSATIYIYRDGTLKRYRSCRATMAIEGQNARPGYATFNITGIYDGEVDAAIPANLAIAGHSAPVLVQGAATSKAALLNRKPLTISSWSLDPGSQIENVDDPNTPYGFGAGQIVDRASQITVDPLKTLIANRDTITDIGNGVRMPAVFRYGSQAGNRWSFVGPIAQPVSSEEATRGRLVSENMTLQLLSGGKDAYGRDGDRILAFS
ncbi:MAG TPA: hypothetical protein DEP91_04370 [Sphingomonas bacterium]|jgi:hypothetical protein|uniref:Uncharacterized protein n=1 Tax=Sphingomonas bacterium TaxID=1895847 RepID=A0A3D0W9G5_9SPHN|nr:hypothetical protein [Sphingomonas bacterium]